MAKKGTFCEMKDMERNRKEGKWHEKIEEKKELKIAFINYTLTSNMCVRQHNTLICTRFVSTGWIGIGLNWIGLESKVLGKKTRTQIKYICLSDLWVDGMLLPLLLLLLLCRIDSTKNAWAHNKFKDFCHRLRIFWRNDMNKQREWKRERERLSKWEALLWTWMAPK